MHAGVTATLELQPPNTFREDVGIIQACVVMEPVEIIQVNITVELGLQVKTVGEHGTTQ